MTRPEAGAPAAGGYAHATAYWQAACEGRPLPHCAGTSAGDLRVLAADSAALAPVHAPTPLVTCVPLPPGASPKPGRSEPALGSSWGSGGSPRGEAPPSSAGSCLDQYHSMLPDNPVQQLPTLLPTCATHTAATVRVAAWLLGDSAAAAGAEAPADADADADSGCACSGRASLDGGSQASEGGLLDELEAAVYGPGGCAPPPPPAGAAVAASASPDADGYRATAYYAAAGRRSVDGFMSRPVQHGDALNNYVAALY